MQATCSECGTRFQAQRRTAKYCTPACSQRAVRRRAITREAEGRPDVTTPPGSESPASAHDATLLVAATIDELAKAGRLGTALGQAALVLADKAGRTSDTGSATAAVVKQLQATLAAALAGAEGQQDPLDELRARRDRKRTG